MIKLNRGNRPKELTDEVQKELTKLYVQNKDKDVWNSPKIKQPLKDALLRMSHKKCSYCECVLGIESKDVTIDHYLPKSTYSDKVVEWENLFPSCLRCNRKKNDNEDELVHPCKDTPSQFIGVCKENRFRLKGIDNRNVGRDTILGIGLNDIERVMSPRMVEWEGIHEKLEEVLEDLREVGYKKRHKNRLEKLMEKCMKENSYSAVKATNMLNDDMYIEVKEILKKNEAWTSKLEEMEQEMKEIALQIV